MNEKKAVEFRKKIKIKNDEKLLDRKAIGHSITLTEYVYNKDHNRLHFSIRHSTTCLQSIL